jgi:hypothetical protein
MGVSTGAQSSIPKSLKEPAGRSKIVQLEVFLQLCLDVLDALLRLVGDIWQSST